MTPDPCTLHRVGVVDDDEAVLDSFRFMLEAAGIAVRTYSSASALLHDDVRPECLILDQNMPLMTGLELTDRLRLEGGNIRIVLVTALPSAEVLIEARRIGIERVLEKPATESDILSFVNSCLDAG